MAWISEKFRGKYGFGASSAAEDITKGVDGTGLTAIVTGATSGICLETARVLALRGVRVAIPVIDLESGQKVKRSIVEKIPNAKIDVMLLDINSLISVRKFASEYRSKGLPLDILILNGGIVTSRFSHIKDGLNLQFVSNYHGNFLLTNLLLDTMKRSVKKSRKEGRIVILSPDIHRINEENPKNAHYELSEYSSALHVMELTRRLKEEGVNITADCLHLGVIATNLAERGGYTGYLYGAYNRIMKNVPQGAATTCHVALNPQVHGIDGPYFSDNNFKDAPDPVSAKDYWDFTLSEIDKINY
ncbi:hypothetical protein L1887_29161 [Cichorium endivia]|nr:hypothetical protein L1887_29161 [Cichorium endivia]